MVPSGAISFRILGEVRVGLIEPVRIPGPRVRALLAALLLRRDAEISDDELAEAVWGEHPPAAPRQALQVVALRLRRALGADAERIERTAGGYAARVGMHELDLALAERLIERGHALRREGQPARAAGAYGEALLLWRGEPLVEFADAPFFADAARHLAELRWQARDLRSGALLATGRGPELVADLSRVAAEEPLREEPQRHLMLALYRAGRQGDALETYEQLRRRLDDELGIAPSAATADLQLRILRHDPELVVPRRAPSTFDASVRRSLEAPSSAGSPFAVRRLGPGDEDVLAVLTARDHRFAADPASAPPREPLSPEAAHAFLADETVLLWVAEARDGMPVGMLLCRLRRHRFAGRPSDLTVEEVGTDLAWRRRGVGRALVGAMEAWMAATGVVMATIPATPDRGSHASGFARRGAEGLAQRQG